VFQSCHRKQQRCTDCPRKQSQNSLFWSSSFDTVISLINCSSLSNCLRIQIQRNSYDRAVSHPTPGAVCCRSTRVHRCCSFETPLSPLLCALVGKTHAAICGNAAVTSCRQANTLIGLGQLGKTSAWKSVENPESREIRRGWLGWRGQRLGPGKRLVNSSLALACFQGHPSHVLKKLTVNSELTVFSG